MRGLNICGCADDVNFIEIINNTRKGHRNVYSGKKKGTRLMGAKNSNAKIKPSLIQNL